MTTIALFPLNSILFPKGRVSLQIFESRYVDMIRRCMKEQVGFGVILIAEGSEVARPGQKINIHKVGTYCEVIDWNELPTGLLGITVEGRKTFKVIESWCEKDGLCRAEVLFRDHDSIDSEPIDVGGEFHEYVDLLRGLARHPMVEDLKLEIGFENLREVAWRLGELLPIPNREKQAVLEMNDPLERLEQIELFINALNLKES